MVSMVIFAMAFATLFVVVFFVLFLLIFVLLRLKSWANKVDTSFQKGHASNPAELKKVGGNLGERSVVEIELNSICIKKDEDEYFNSFSKNPSNVEEEEEEERGGKNSPKALQKKLNPQESLWLSNETDPISDIEDPTPPMVLETKSQSQITDPLPIQIDKIPPPPPLPLFISKRSLLKPSLDRKNATSDSAGKTGLELRAKVNSKNKADALEGEKVKLKPLHWDKLTLAMADHSVVWDEIHEDGSLRFDDDEMENLFGYNTASNNFQFPGKNNLLSSSVNSNTGLKSLVFLLEPRKSQNVAIVLRSLAVSRKEILDALVNGHGLDSDTLEKLTRVSPTKEEEIKILQFNDNPNKLADAESFLYQILRAIPSAFSCFKAMLFRENYEVEILLLKESLETVESGCKELRACKLFVKLLEAVLRAGNRMNAGTAKGNAQGFDLSALQKLSDVKSNDRKTTLLHFVIEQVARSEGRHCQKNINRNLSYQRTRPGEPGSENPLPEAINKEYLDLGLLILRELRTELTHVKKAATLDYDSFINLSSNIEARAWETSGLVKQCGDGERSGFVREMKRFLEECEEELKAVREEQRRVMELVNRTSEYFLTGSSQDKRAHPFQLFCIVRDFLELVDQACIYIDQKQRNPSPRVIDIDSSPPLSPLKRAALRFPDFYIHPKSDMSSTSSDTDGDF